MCPLVLKEIEEKILLSNLIEIFRAKGMEGRPDPPLRRNSDVEVEHEEHFLSSNQVCLRTMMICSKRQRAVVVVEEERRSSSRKEKIERALILSLYH